MAEATDSGPAVGADTAGTWDESWGAVQCLAGRYRVVHVAGSGGSGTVYVAEDTDSGERVACKWLHGPEDPRLPREIAALQRLDDPGVVRLRDVTRHEGRPVLVMDLVDGAPWPGALPEGDARGRWRALRPRLVALLEVLGRVHAAGVVHRDLKPGNVLVDEEGQPTVLDFGLARGASLGTTITRQGVLVGTPRYLSPEVMSGHRPDARADLYSVGVMAFEALAGRPPHQGEDFGALHRARTGAPAPDLRLLHPAVPQAAADLVADLLRRDPDERPPSADAVLARLGADRAGERIPWLGDRAVVDAVVAALAAGRAVRVSGPPGSGRSRVLREAQAALERAGHVGRWLVPGARPFESLGVELDRGSAVEVRAVAADVLASALAEGPVFVDEHRRLDRWTRALVDDAEGPIGQAVAPGGGRGGEELRLALLTAADLRALFHGPSRFLHLPEDAAALLHARTAGVPARVAATVEAWVADGILAWEEGRLRVDRAALDREAARGEAPRLDIEVEVEAALGDTLQLVHVAGEEATVAVLAAATGRPAWELELELAELAEQGAVLEDEGGVWRALARPAGTRLQGAARVQAWHAAVADALPSGSVARVRHLLAAGRSDGLLDEAAEAAVVLWRAGRLDRARALVVEVLEVAATTAGPSATRRLVGIGARLAIASGTAAARAAAVEAAQRFAPTRRDVLALLEGAEAVAVGQPERAAELLDDLVFPDAPVLETGRQVVRMQAVRGRTAATEAALLDELEEWARSSLDPEAAALVQGWRGLQAYREGRFEEAAALHRTAAAGKRTVTGRLSSLLNAASALMEGCRLEEAEAISSQALVLAARTRQPRFEARAWLLQRNITTRRSREWPAPDLAVVEDITCLGSPVLEGQAALLEARLAWRCGGHARVASLARHAEGAFSRAGDTRGEASARAMRVAVGDSAAPSPETLAVARGDIDSSVSLQLELRALLALGGHGFPGDRTEVARMLQNLSIETTGIARGLFTPRELADILEPNQP